MAAEETDRKPANAEVAFDVIEFEPTATETSSTPEEPGSGRGKQQRFWILGSVAIAAVLLAYLLMAQTVSLRLLDATDGSHIDPQQLAGDIAIDGLLTLTLGDRFLLIPGSHQITVELAGYEPQVVSEEINADTGPELSLTLNRLPGFVKISSNTPAQVHVEGLLAGFSDEPLGPLPPGDYTLSVTADRYQTQTQAITVQGRDQTEELQVELLPNWADITLSSSPAGAEILIDGTPSGATPSTLSLLAGTREITLRLNGYQDFHQLQQVAAGEPQELDTIQLIAAARMLQVTTSPAAAEVTLSGQYLGSTPLQIPLATEASATLQVFKEGYQPYRQQVSPDTLTDDTLAITLQPVLGKITVSAQPSDALLYVDGRLMGRAAQTLTLPAHEHDIRITAPGHADYTATILPRSGLEQRVTAQLLTDYEYRWKNTPKTITTKANQNLLLFRPDVEFTMGASRREQGRRANEAQYTVKLQRAFYLGEKLVTNREYRRFSAEHSSGHVQGESLNGDNQPAVNVSWQQAAAYCNWLSEQEGLTPFYVSTENQMTSINADANGYRLPTEAEWAWAARFEEGQMLKYAWGDQLLPPANFANVADRSAAAVAPTVLSQYNDGYAVTSPVGQFPANTKGLFDLSGNAAEWINDRYGIRTASLSLKADTDPLGPETGDYYVIRGNSWAQATMTDLRLSFRDYGRDPRNTVGFRVARYVESIDEDAQTP